MSGGHAEEPRSNPHAHPTESDGALRCKTSDSARSSPCGTTVVRMPYCRYREPVRRRVRRTTHMFGECLCQVGKGGEASAHACSANPTRDVADRSRLETVGGNRGAAGERWELITDREKVFDPGLHELHVRQPDDVHLKRPKTWVAMDVGRRMATWAAVRGASVAVRGASRRVGAFCSPRATDAHDGVEWLNARRSLRPSRA